MKIKQIVDVIENAAPLSLAEEWDNVGLMVGDLNGECTGVMLALDLTADVVKQAIEQGCELIVTHHPFIFRPLKHIDFGETKGATIKLLIQNGISVYSAHTNLDKSERGLNAALCKMFKAKSFAMDGVGAIFTVDKTTLADFAKRTASLLGDKSVRMIGDPDRTVERVYVVSGSGGSEYSAAMKCADVLLTGDLKHHNYIDAIEDGFALVEYSHFASEIIAQDVLEDILKETNIKIIKAKQSSPFRLLEEI